MRLMSKVLLGGLATAALAGTAVAAEHVHVMNVAMPDGGVAKVRYVGDTPPVVRFVPVRAIPVMPVAMIDPGFAAMDRMMAAMDAHADAMMRRAAMLSHMPATGVPLQHADMQKLPGGTVSYSYVSTTSSNGCTQTVRMTSDGSADQPQVIRTSAGTCDGAKVSPAVANGVAPARTVNAVETKPAAKQPIDPNTI
jgi:hypothetical protein